MPRTEVQLIELCKKLIEEKFSFGNGQGYTQRDLELLSKHLEKETGVLISLSTLKRLWKSDFKKGPQLATLNALTTILGYKDWQDFKISHQKRSVPRRVVWVGSGVAVGILIVVVLAMTRSASGYEWGAVEITGPVAFSADKTVAVGVPTTTVFHYDVSNVIADSFYIQQSWNDYQRTSIDPLGKANTSIYYESGYHRAHLFANDSPIAMVPVHILSRGWEPHIYYSYANNDQLIFQPEEVIVAGDLQMERVFDLNKPIDTTRYFFSRIINSQEFGVHSDHFEVETNMKVQRRTSEICHWMELIVVTEKHIFWVMLSDKGCELHASYKMGEVIRSGEDHDLSGFGTDVFEWQKLKISCTDRLASIWLNDELIGEELYTEDYGQVVGLIYLFPGTGAIDFVRISGEDGELVYEDYLDDSM